MTYGVIHYNAPGATLDEFLAWASGAGFESVELQIGDLWPDEGQCPIPTTEAARDLVNKYGLKVSAIASGNDFVVLEADEVEKQCARMKTICDLAVMMDCNTIRTEGGSPKDSVPEERWAEAIAGCCQASLGFLKELGVRYAIDNHGWVTNKIDVIMDVLKGVNEPKWVGSNLDTMNVRWFGNTLEDIDEFYRQVAPWVMHTHMKDGEGARENYRGRDLGNGEINLDLAVECVKAAGYDGAWTAEYEGRENTAIGYEKCLVWMKHKI